MTKPYPMIVRIARRGRPRGYSEIGVVTGVSGIATKDQRIPPWEMDHDMVTDEPEAG